MFWPIISECKQYYKTPLGQLACRHIRKVIHELWSDPSDDNIVGIGFTNPYLRCFSAKENSIFSLFPYEMGKHHFAPQKINQSALIAEDEIPLPNNSINRVILAHALEHANNPEAILEEIYRILTPSGRVLIMVPHRRGLWTRAEHTPYGKGRPYSMSQLIALIEQNQFVPTRKRSALYFPPTTSRIILKLHNILEALGRTLFAPTGGVIIVEAEKQIPGQGGKKESVKQASKAFIPATAMPFNKRKSN